MDCFSRSHGNCKNRDVLDPNSRCDSSCSRARGAPRNCDPHLTFPNPQYSLKFLFFFQENLSRSNLTLAPQFLPQTGNSGGDLGWVRAIPAGIPAGIPTFPEPTHHFFPPMSCCCTVYPKKDSLDPAMIWGLAVSMLKELPNPGGKKGKDPSAKKLEKTPQGQLRIPKSWKGSGHGMIPIPAPFLLGVGFLESFSQILEDAPGMV